MGNLPLRNGHNSPPSKHPRTAEIESMWMSLFCLLDLNEEGDIMPLEIQGVLRVCPDSNALREYLKTVLYGNRKPISKHYYVSLIRGYLKITGDPSERTYKRNKLWLQSLRDTLIKRAEARIYEMNSIQKSIFKAMDLEGKGLLDVRILRTYLSIVRDPYGIIRSFAARCEDKKIPQEEFMQRVKRYLSANGTPRRCHIEDARTDLTTISVENRRRMMVHLKKSWNHSCGLFRGLTKFRCT
mmetsp:Transcript_7511/g.10593  ORF Transcript_7511/g.10593 Transcript_7511/m.10593 type:complete len:241 (+) Transcript_7511:392-1114(+)|eukprot:CAMPEP_0184503820 /NCGR_PEP_ID=MMETSP0113_2-20130426/52108_1 /TAXON_ID=91329 /ORGANISM="Norrisiella sphaerica, Strain BC52" /LENGTH=240 /DNA_ID=CAMNT_0026893377 /DNA_START=421 /DNA_END=1143 /DNA_ORIENTATION=+